MFKKGQIVNTWHDSGCFGQTMVFGKVIRVNRKTVTVRWKHGYIKRIEPHHLELVTGKLAQEIEAGYLSEPPNKA